MDARYILSGSDDGNIRLWKMNASESISIKNPRQAASLNYNAALRTKYANVDEIRRISHHRHIPKAIKSASVTKQTILKSEKRKEENSRRHSKKEVARLAERAKPVLTRME
jgi:WD repeat and SOF domain-containing protein 1